MSTIEVYVVDGGIQDDEAYCTTPGEAGQMVEYFIRMGQYPIHVWKHSMSEDVFRSMQDFLPNHD